MIFCIYPINKFFCCIYTSFISLSLSFSCCIIYYTILVRIFIKRN
nr:MAG TPA: hypothetical protein [Bacteriophage sp.]